MSSRRKNNDSIEKHDKIKYLESKISPSETKNQATILNNTFGNIPADDTYFENTYNQITESKKYNQLLREIKQKELDLKMEI